MVASLEDLEAVNLKIPFLWVMTLRHW